MTPIDDLIKRLRNDVGEWNDREMGHPDEWDRYGKDVFALAIEAADALERLKAALEGMMEFATAPMTFEGQAPSAYELAYKAARRALNGETQ